MKKLHKQLSAAETAVREERYGDAIDKLTSALSTEDKVTAFVDRIESQFCHCHSKVTVATATTTTRVLVVERHGGGYALV